MNYISCDCKIQENQRICDLCARRHQSQIKEEHMDAEDYNGSMSPETDDQQSPDTNHDAEYADDHSPACLPALSWDPGGSAAPRRSGVPTDSHTWKWKERFFIYYFILPVSVVCNGLTSAVLKGWRVDVYTRPRFAHQLAKREEGAVGYTRYVCILNTTAPDLNQRENAFPIN